MTNCRKEDGVNVKISLECNKGVPCCCCESKLCVLGLLDYSTYTIFLGATYIDPDEVEVLTEDTLNHEMMHAVLSKRFDEATAREYDRIYHLVEPKGRVVIMEVGE